MSTKPTTNLRVQANMSGEDKSFLYQTLNECVALLNEDVATGSHNVYVTADRSRHTALLKKIAEAKRLIVRANTREFSDG